MEKFYYYAFQSKGFFGSGIRYADDGCFNLAEMHKFLQETPYVFVYEFILID